MEISLSFLLLSLLTAVPIKSNQGIDGVQLLVDDILLTEQQRTLFELANQNSDPNRSQRAVVSQGILKWKDGIVPYIIDDSLTSKAKLAIVDAIEEYENSTCIRFRQKRSNDSDYIRFYYGIGCSSYIGRVGGEQHLSLSNGCESKGIVIHEIFHALGRWHEQSRPDRDYYVQIDFSSVISGYETNFRKAPKVFSTTQGVPYDYDSVMHYNAYAFTVSPKSPTIRPLSDNVALTRLGQREGLSINDRLHIKSLYCPDGNGEWSSWGTWSTCSRTCNRGTRTRRRYCVGGTDCIGQNIDEEQCNTNECPILPVWSSWSKWSGCSTTCGIGKRTRLRYCINGTTCVGASHQFEDCNIVDCPAEPHWSEWSSCSKSCEGGYRYRTRQCKNDITSNCTGTSMEKEQCNTEIACGDSNSSTWTLCSKSCGSGIQFRRTAANETENRTCNIQPCHNEHCLQGITHVDCYDYNDNLITLEGKHALLMDSPYNRTQPIQKCAQVAYENNYKYFALSMRHCYSITDSINDYLRAFTCTNGTGSTGNYSELVLSMDVYLIQNENLLSNSVEKINNCGMDYCTVKDYVCNIYSGSNIIKSTFNLLIFILVLIIIVL